MKTSIQIIIESQKTRLLSLGIRSKIFSGFGVVLALMTAVSAFSYFGFVSVSRGIDEYAGHVEEASLTARIESEFLKLRLYAREYAKSGREEDAGMVHRLADGISPILATAEAHAAAPEHAEDVREMAAALDLYIKDFAKAEMLQREYRALIREQLEPNGVKVVEDLDEIIKQAGLDGNDRAMALAATARERALLARLYANILIGRQDDSFGEKAERKFVEMRKAMRTLEGALRTGEERRLHDEASTLFDAYEAAFRRVRKDKSEIRHLVEGEMAEAARTITTEAEHLQTELVEIENAVRESTADDILLAEVEMLAASGLGLAAGLIAAWALSGTIADPVTAMTTAMRRLSGNDLEVGVPALGRGDEIGSMADAVQVFKHNAIRIKRIQDTEEEKLAHEEAEHRRSMAQMADSFENAVGEVVNGVASSAQEMEAAAASMTSIAEETALQSAAAGGAAETASSSVQTVASAAEELSMSISGVSRGATEAAAIATAAVKEAGDANGRIQTLSGAADNISQMVSLIDDIAGQTNLLALNATIEAARAGGAGKGFAVVASEVKSLALQTAKATKEISDLVRSIQEEVGATVGSIDQIGKTIGRINELTQAMATSVEQQRAATDAIARNAQDAAQGAGEVTYNIRGVREAASDTGSAAEQVLGSARSLGAHSTQLESAMRKFLNRVRTA